MTTAHLGSGAYVQERQESEDGSKSWNSVATIGRRRRGRMQQGDERLEAQEAEDDAAAALAASPLDAELTNE